MKGGPWSLWGGVSPDEQVIAILRQAEVGVPGAELCRKHGIGNAAFNKGRAKYWGMDASMISQMKAMDRAISRHRSE